MTNEAEFLKKILLGLYRAGKKDWDSLGYDLRGTVMYNPKEIPFKFGQNPLRFPDDNSPNSIFPLPVLDDDEWRPILTFSWRCGEKIPRRGSFRTYLLRESDPPVSWSVAFRFDDWEDRDHRRFCHVQLCDHGGPYHGIFQQVFASGQIPAEIPYIPLPAAKDGWMDGPSILLCLLASLYGPAKALTLFQVTGATPSFRSLAKLFTEGEKSLRKWNDL